jgi:hypothetical protein
MVRTNLQQAVEQHKSQQEQQGTPTKAGMPLTGENIGRGRDKNNSRDTTAGTPDSRNNYINRGRKQQGRKKRWKQQ